MIWIWSALVFSILSEINYEELGMYHMRTIRQNTTHSIHFLDGMKHDGYGPIINYDDVIQMSGKKSSKMKTDETPDLSLSVIFMF